MLQANGRGVQSCFWGPAEFSSNTPEPPNQSSRLTSRKVLEQVEAKLFKTFALQEQHWTPLLKGVLNFALGHI